MQKTARWETSSESDRINRIKSDLLYAHLPEFLEQDPLLHVEPDIVYALDPRQFYEMLDDPWEDQPRVPKICGGFFYAKSNDRTINLYKKLGDAIPKEKLNDQYATDHVLNHQDYIKHVAVVGKLPRCLGRIKNGPIFCPGRNVSKAPENLEEYFANLKSLINQDTVRVGLLDLWQFINNVALENEWGHFYKDLLLGKEQLDFSSRSVPARIPIAYHANSWNKGKEGILKDMGMWYLNSDLMCQI